ncbi:helix-turn-helix domain-containing protein [Flindersiella endophytica]
MANDDDMATVLDAVGPRLRAVRRERDLTLTQLSEATGISASTLSRLESGQRKPTLELLLPLAKAFGVQLDELVGAPPTGDPRVHLRSFTRNGITYLPLTRGLGAPQAYKAIYPGRHPDDDLPEQRAHEGYDWLYVLSGRLRLLLGAHDLVLKPGEVAEFDTRTPHAFISADTRPVEVLALFGPQGERMHVRARPKPSPKD